jgi:hypothetical protein
MSLVSVTLGSLVAAIERLFLWGWHLPVCAGIEDYGPISFLRLGASICGCPVRPLLCRGPRLSLQSHAYPIRPRCRSLLGPPLSLERESPSSDNLPLCLECRHLRRGPRPLKRFESFVAISQDIRLMHCFTPFLTEHGGFRTLKQ